jgi:hypothetical protein
MIGTKQYFYASMDGKKEKELCFFVFFNHVLNLISYDFFKINKMKFYFIKLISMYFFLHCKYNVTHE